MYIYKVYSTLTFIYIYIYIYENRNKNDGEVKVTSLKPQVILLSYVMIKKDDKICLLQQLFNFSADPCYNYHNLSEANRKSSYVAPLGLELCDNQLPVGWYRFVGAAGTKMPTTRVPAFRCGTDWSGWLDGAHPTVEEGQVLSTVCFSDRSTGCKFSIAISVKNCGSFYIYKLAQHLKCFSRYCGTD